MLTSVYQADRKMHADQLLFHQDSAVGPKCRRWSSLPWRTQISQCSGFLSSCSSSVITPPTLPVFTLVLSHPTASSFSADMWSSLICSTVLDFKHSAELPLGVT